MLSNLDMETIHLLIRNLEGKDANDYYEIYSHPDVRPRTGNSKPFSDLQAAEMHLSEIASNKNQFAIVEKISNKMIGKFKISNYSIERAEKYFPELLELTKQGKVLTISYAINPKYWNKGYCTEALKKMVEYAFIQLGAEYIMLGYFIQNKASGKVMEKCGFKYKKTVPVAGFWYLTGEKRQLVKMALSKKDWEKLSKEN